MPRRANVSPPLPLPVHFALLPSQLPGRTLSPLLYTLIDGTPVFLTLTPSHQPHLSMLPLLLALQPIPPIHILTSLHLSPLEYTLTLDGLTPFVDLWLPFDVARRVVGVLGCARLFWDDKDAERGLLGMGSRDSVSWDEGGAIGHNWLPSAKNLPPSSYSLSALLNTPFSSISIIPDERCISTPIDSGRRASLLAEGLDDRSGIRQGDWGRSWEGLLRWSVMWVVLERLTTGLMWWLFRAWEDFLRHPSKPPSEPRVASSNTPNLSTIPTILHDLLPRIPALTTPNGQPSFALTLPDLTLLLDPNPIPPEPSLLSHLLTTVLAFRPFRRLPTDGSSPAEIRRVQLHTRANLAMAEMAGWVMVGTWRAQRNQAAVEEDRHRLPQPNGTRSSDDPVERKTQGRDIIQENGDGLPENGDEEGRRDSSPGDDVELGQSIESLERRRGGSPPPQIDRKRTRSNASGRTNDPRPAARTRHSRQPANENEPIFEVEHGPMDVVRDRGEDLMEAVHEVLMHSENGEGWWMYVSMVAVVGVALIAGLIGRG